MANRLGHAPGPPPMVASWMAPHAAIATSAGRLIEFQRNAAFMAFMIIIVVAAATWLVKGLRNVLIPLIWAVFFALPLERMVRRIDKIIVGSMSLVASLFRKEAPATSIEFRHLPGKNSFIIQNTRQNMAMLQRLRNPFAGGVCYSYLLQKCGGPAEARPGSRTITLGRSLGCSLNLVFKCCQRRVRISELSHSADTTANAVRAGWCYYVGDVQPEGSELHLQLFLDQGCWRYPAVVEDQNAERTEECGRLEMDTTSALSWVVALLFVFIVLACGAALFVGLLILSFNSFKDNIDAYEKGVDQLIRWLQDVTNRLIPSDVWETINKHLQSFLATSVTTFVEDFLSGISEILFQYVLFFIYLLFWLSGPIPVASPVVEVFKTYLFLKSIICLLFASLMSGLLFKLNCGLWPLFFVITFILNFIPEIGALLAGLLSLPAVLLDGSVPLLRDRLWNTLYLCILGLLFKFITGNIIEVQMYATKGGEFMRMHSVVLMALIMLFGEMLGVTGMFLSVPIVAAIKYFLVSARMPPSILDPLLCFIEGDDAAAHRYFVDKCWTEQESSRTNRVVSSGSAADAGVGQGPPSNEAVAIPQNNPELMASPLLEDVSIEAEQPEVIQRPTC